MTTFASLFSGGGLADVGLRQAGLQHLWGVELDPARAAVARANGFHVHAADVLAVDPKTLEAPDWLHASPPCTSFSQANPRAAQADGGRATVLDRALALRVLDFSAALRPLWVSVENVGGWEDTEPMRAVVAGLEAQGYMVAWWLLNAADFGTPQSRRRLFVLASWVGRPQPPASTHSRLGGLFERPWVGWEAVCDGWQDEPCRPLTDRMSATLIYSKQKNLIVNSNTKNHREKIVIDSHHRTLVAGGTHAPILDPQGVRLPSHRAPHEPAPAMTCGSCLQVVTPQGAHTLTARHVARLAGLPDEWVLPSTLTMTREVCGLGVCPPVMRALALAQAAPPPRRGAP